MKMKALHPGQEFNVTGKQYVADENGELEVFDLSHAMVLRTHGAADIDAALVKPLVPSAEQEAERQRLEALARDGGAKTQEELDAEAKAQAEVDALARKTARLTELTLKDGLSDAENDELATLSAELEAKK